jgi:hypothetical protein
MSSLLYVGTGDDEIVEHADWVEATTLYRDDGNASQEDLARAINVARGVDQEEARELAQDAFDELADRHYACGANEHPEISSYPFDLIDGNTILQKKPDAVGSPDAGLLYLFLLVLTRADMSSRARTVGGIDPTRVFERLCADVLKEFWGGDSDHCQCLVFGTAQRAGKTGFQNSVEHLCGHLQEGVGWKANARTRGAGDGKLDVVVYRRFRDKRAGSLVGFAQCKTGIHWRQHLTSLQPRAFCQSYMVSPPLLDPMRIYMVPNRIAAGRWDEDTAQGGLLFDRCRIVQYGNSISTSTLNDCRKWLRAILAKDKKVP